MKAVVVTESGFEIAEVAKPIAGPEDVLVKVRACGLNRADLGVLAGGAHGKVGGVGAIPGIEWAGEVAEVGARVRGIKPGDRVMCSGSSGYAEYAVADWGRVMDIPKESMSYAEAVTLPIAIQTMHNAIVTVGELKKGETVLVQGASSGVGLMAMQIAKLMGAKTVIGTSTTPERREQLTKFGADFAIDNSDPKWPQHAIDANGGRGVDLIIDQLSGPFGTQNLEACAILGRIVNVGRMAGRFAEFDFDLHALKRIKYTGVTFRTRSVEEVRSITSLALGDLGAHLESGKLSLPIDSTFAFADIAQAFERMRTNKHFGKIVAILD